MSSSWEQALLGWPEMSSTSFIVGGSFAYEEKKIMQELTARLRLLSEGGRKAGIRSGYIATLFVQGLYTAARIQLVDRDEANPGESFDAKLALPVPQTAGAKLVAGASFTLVEGERTIGEGVVTGTRSLSQLEIKGLVTLDDLEEVYGMSDASEEEGLKAFCPKCGIEMKSRFDGDRLVEARCERGDMDFSRAVAAELSREFFEDSSGRDVTKPLYAPSLWYCPRDGAQMWQSDRRTYTCTTCGRDLEGRILWSLVELHPHS